MPKHIKICYILPEYNENTDSHFFHIYELLEELSSPSAGKARKIDIFLIVEKANTKNIKISKKIYIQKFRFLPLRFLESFFAALKARLSGYKIFYTHYCYIGGINAAIISRLSGGKSYYWNCAMNWLFKQKKLSGLAFLLCLRLSHFLVTGGEIMKRGYVEHYRLKPDRVKIMPNWINLDRFKSQKSQPKAGPPRAEKLKTLLFVHWLSKRKGADMIVPLANQLSKILNTKYKILVVGDGPYKEKLLEEINENKLGEFVKVIGSVPNKNLIDYYAQADVFIMPSMEEGFPRVLLEAMACGIPYVASDVGAVREMSSETAQRFLVKSGDAEMFARKIESLLSDKKLYDSFKKEELEKAKEYSMENVINKFIGLFS